jgi:hypothetical protein
MFALVKMIMFVFLAFTGLLVSFGVKLGLLSLDDGFTPFLSTLVHFAQYVLKASIALPFLFSKYVAPFISPRWSGFIMIILVFLWLYYFMFHPIVFVFGSLMVGYVWMVVDHFLTGSTARPRALTQEELERLAARQEELHNERAWFPSSFRIRRKAPPGAFVPESTEATSTPLASLSSET